MCSRQKSKIVMEPYSVMILNRLKNVRTFFNVASDLKATIVKLLGSIYIYSFYLNFDTVKGSF